jgi:hypothetical protein
LDAGTGAPGNDGTAPAPLTWTTLTSPQFNGDEPISIWGSSSTDVYVGTTGPAVYHSTGNGQWTRQMVGTSMLYSQGLWGSGPHDVYVAKSGPLPTAATEGLFHSTGDGNWTTASPTTTPLTLYAI